MPTTAPAAYRAAEAFVSRERPWCQVSSLLEDDDDYFVVTELLPGQEWPLGPQAMMISKETGELREEPYVLVMDRVDRMQPVLPGS